MMLARFHRGRVGTNMQISLPTGQVTWPMGLLKQNGCQYGNYGNFHYGAVGALRLEYLPILLRAAGWAQSKSGNGNSKDGHLLWFPSF
jgi:hypothetical protein